MKPKHILFGMLALFAASCANDEMNEVAALKQNGIQVTAGLRANTRVNFEQDGNVTHALWEEGDQITLYAPSQGYLPYQVSTLSEDATSATFTPINDALQNTDETIYAAHRADMEADIADGMATLPNTDTWTDEHPLPFAYAISKVADGKLNLSFEHVFAYLKLTLNAETVAGSTNKSIAVIGLSTTSDEPLSNIYGFFNIPEQEYVIEKGSNHMFFTLQEPFTATGTAEKSVYIPILPQSAGKTITINIFGDYEAADTLFTESKEVPSTGFVAGRAYTYSPKSSITRVGNTVTLTEAGTLSQAISATEKDTITSLKIIGPLNGDDIRLIREMAGSDVWGDSTEGKLTDLDISEAFIVEGGGSYYTTGYTSYTTEDNVIGELMFAETILERIQLPQNITSIADRSFQFSSLTNITIPNNVTTIGSQVFYNCSSLTDVSIGLGVTTIGASAFRRCTSLTSITIPNGITEIADYTFLECSSLSGVVIGSDVTSIGAYAFQLCTSLPTITLPESLLSIGEETFERCTLLSKVTCNAATPPTLGSSALKNIASSATLNVPSGTYSAYMASDWAQYFTTIDDGEEHGSYENGVATVVTAGTLSTLIPEEEKYTITTLKVVGPLNGDDIRFIREMAGRDVNGDETEGQLVDLDMSEASIVEGGGEYTGSYYPNDDLNAGYISSSYTSDNKVGNYMFSLTILKNITLPSNITSIGEGAFCYCVSLPSITIPDGVTSIGEWAFRGCSSLANITIPDGLTSIEDHAFYNCSSLISINIPDGITSIGAAVFYRCSALPSITLPSNITSIGSGAFIGCSALASINIPSGVTSIGINAFLGCSSLANITIPDGVTLIEDNTFNGCTALTSINIPDGVTSIGRMAFEGCNSLLEVTSNASIPPTLGSSCFQYIYSSTLIVPTGTYAAYMASDWASYFTTIEEK